VLFEAARPILLNGIEEVVSRPDLGDRAIFLTLAPIGEAQRRPESELWREFEIARPQILGGLLDAVVHGLRALGGVHLDRLPRMADFALWAAACETALWPAGTFVRAYASNRRTAIEGMIEADPVAACVRGLMAGRSAWTGSAADLLRAVRFRGCRALEEKRRLAKNTASAGRLRRAQTFLRMLGIEVRFSRDGRAGTRMITVSTLTEHIAGTVSSVRHQRSRSGAEQPQPADDVRDDKYRPDLVGLCSIGQASVTATDDADGADANAAFCIG
jgi:hypothetical protein